MCINLAFLWSVTHPVKTYSECVCGLDSGWTLRSAKFWPVQLKTGGLNAVICHPIRVSFSISCILGDRSDGWLADSSRWGFPRRQFWIDFFARMVLRLFIHVVFLFSYANPFWARSLGSTRLKSDIFWFCSSPSPSSYFVLPHKFLRMYPSALTISRSLKLKNEPATSVGQKYTEFVSSIISGLWRHRGKWHASLYCLSHTLSEAAYAHSTTNSPMYPSLVAGHILLTTLSYYTRTLHCSQYSTLPFNPCKYLTQARVILLFSVYIGQCVRQNV